MLADYLDVVSRRHFRYGQLDCCTFMADWLMMLGWPDAMPDRRGTYGSHREYRRMIKSEGGMVASCTARFARLGLRETSEPLKGDVALVLAPARFGRRAVLVCTGAICASPSMRAIVAPDVALAAARLETVKAWSSNG